MDANRFDRISKLFARRRSRRSGSTRLTTPAAGSSGAAPELLFVQSFRAGAIAPKDGVDGRYTLTLEAGTGQTVYFSDRPDRIVGAAPTSDVLERLGFPDDNPPNAALVIETGPGEIDVAVVELFSPVHDEATGGVTYEVAVLANWEAELAVGLQKTPTDLAALAPSFGAAHLFIDGVVEGSDWDCMQWAGGAPLVTCLRAGYNSPGQFNNVGYCWRSPAGICAPCEPADGDQSASAITRYWAAKCNQEFAGCGGECIPATQCPRGLSRSECWHGGM